MRTLAVLMITAWTPEAAAQPRRVDKREVASLPPAVQVVAGELFSADALTRAEAARKLAGMGEAAAPAARLLAAMFEDDAPLGLTTTYTGGVLGRHTSAEKWSPGAEAALTLATIRCAPCIEALADGLGHASPVVRTNVAAAITERRLREPRLAGPMTAAAQDAERDVRRHAIRWLAARPGESEAGALMAALRDTDTGVRSEALGGLESYMERFEDPRLADALAGRLADSDRPLQRRAAMLLATLEDRRAAPVLVGILRDATASAKAKDDARLYLTRLSGRNLGADPAAWEKWLAE